MGADLRFVSNVQSGQLLSHIRQGQGYSLQGKMAQACRMFSAILKDARRDAEVEKRDMKSEVDLSSSK